MLLFLPLVFLFIHLSLGFIAVTYYPEENCKGLCEPEQTV